MQRSTLLVSLLALCLTIVSAQFPLSPKEYFLGDWQLESQKTNLAEPSVVGPVENSSWKIKDGNLTLYGTYVDLEKDEERPIFIEFEGDRAGRFALALPEEEDHVVIFEFSFENRSAGFFVSQGLWKDDHRGETGTYQFLVTSPASFILSVVLKNSDGHFSQINVITGRKFVEKEPAGFLQRFGMPLALFAVIMVSQFLKGRQAAPPAPTPDGGGGGRREEGEGEGEATEGAATGEGSSDSASEGKKDK